MKTVDLGSLVAIQTGKLDANANRPDGEYPFFTCARENLRIDRYSYDCECVLVAGNGDLNVKYYAGKFDAYQRTYILESRDTDVLSTRYLYYFMETYVARLREMAIGGVIKYIKLNYLTEAQIPLPSIDEQQRCVALFDKARELIDKRCAQREALELLAKNLFLEMFGDPVAGKRWDYHALRERADVRDGTHDSPHYVAEGYPLVTSRNLRNGRIDLEEVNYISKEDYEAINKRSKVDYGDILMPMIGTIGNPVIVNMEPRFAIKNVALIKCNDPALRNVYLKHLLQSHFLDHIMQKNTRGGTQKFLSLTDIRNMEIPVPPVELQERFAAMIDRLEQQQALVSASLVELETNLQALMQQAFSGRLFRDDPALPLV